MAFVSLSNISESSRKFGNYRRGGRHRDANSKFVVIGTGTGGKDKKGVLRKAFVIRLSKALAKEARILHGDRVDFLFDPEAKVGLLKRINKGGFAASATGKRADTINPGEYYCVTIKATYFPGMPLLDGYRECETAVVTDEGILFDLPPEVTF